MTKSPWLPARVLALALCVFGLALPAFAEGPSKLDKVLRAARGKGGSQRVIIQTTREGRNAVKKALQQHGDVVHAEHPGLNALTAAVHGDDLAALEANPLVLSVSVDAEVTAFGIKKAPQKAASDVLQQSLGLAAVPYTGAGTNVAVVDSGIDASGSLAGRVAGFWDFTRGGVASRPWDDYGHGTHVAGLIAGYVKGTRSGFSGVAPAARLYGFKVLDKNGRGRASDVVRALEFIVANRKSAAPGAIKIDIINLSLGHPIYEPAASDPLVRAVEQAVRAGIVVITAAGNFGTAPNGKVGYAGITSPGNAPSAITVGALDTRNTVQTGDDRVADFSSRGPTWFDGFAKPDVVAPGVALTSSSPSTGSLYTAYPQIVRYSDDDGRKYSELSGTSMASAVAAGVAALVLEASRGANQGGPGLKPNALKAILQYSALPLRNASGRSLRILAQGAGSVNPRGAVDLAEAIDPSMPAGSGWLRGRLQPVTRIAGAPRRWSQTLIWGAHRIQRSDALLYASPQWLDNIVWGTALGLDNIVWGTAADVDNIVWGTASASWASRLAWPGRVVGLMTDDENIVWGTFKGLELENIVWGTWNGDNIVWGTFRLLDDIVWGTFFKGLDNIVWGTSGNDNIVWGTTSGGSR